MKKHIFLILLYALIGSVGNYAQEQISKNELLKAKVNMRRDWNQKPFLKKLWELPSHSQLMSFWQKAMKTIEKDKPLIVKPLGQEQEKPFVASTETEKTHIKQLKDLTKENKASVLCFNPKATGRNPWEYIRYYPEYKKTIQSNRISSDSYDYYDYKENEAFSDHVESFLMNKADDEWFWSQQPFPIKLFGLKRYNERMHGHRRNINTCKDENYRKDFMHSEKCPVPKHLHDFILERRYNNE